MISTGSILSSKISIQGWLNLKMQNLQILRADCSYYVPNSFEYVLWAISLDIPIALEGISVIVVTADEASDTQRGYITVQNHSVTK
jgi:hypothetical protein